MIRSLILFGYFCDFFPMQYTGSIHTKRLLLLATMCILNRWIDIVYDIRQVLNRRPKNHPALSRVSGRRLHKKIQPPNEPNSLVQLKTKSTHIRSRHNYKSKFWEIPTRDNCINHNQKQFEVHRVKLAGWDAGLSLYSNDQWSYGNQRNYFDV